MLKKWVRVSDCPSVVFIFIFFACFQIVIKTTYDGRFLKKNSAYTTDGLSTGKHRKFQLISFELYFK